MGYFHKLGVHVKIRIGCPVRNPLIGYRRIERPREQPHGSETNYKQGKLMARSDSYALPLDTNNDSLELIGGKGKSLARMANAGFSVPTGFHLTTEAYKRFVDRNGLQSKILELAKPEISGIALSFEQASNNIRDLFDQGEVSDDIVAEMTTAYTALDGNAPAVAIRSSANAEDLPELSFAGQQ